MKSKTIFIFIVIVLLGIILIQNTQIITIQLFFWKLSMSRIILISLLVIIGFIVGFLVAKLESRPKVEQKLTES